MNLPMRSENCLYCGTSLVPDPHNRQWSHCPKCAPAWTDNIDRQEQLLRFERMRQQVMGDQRGRPTRRPA